MEPIHSKVATTGVLFLQWYPFRTRNRPIGSSGPSALKRTRSGPRVAGTWTQANTSSGEPIDPTSKPSAKRLHSTENELLNQPPYLPKLKIWQNANYTRFGSWCCPDVQVEGPASSHSFKVCPSFKSPISVPVGTWVFFSSFNDLLNILSFINTFFITCFFVLPQ